MAQKKTKVAVLQMIIDISLILPYSICTTKSGSLNSKRGEKGFVCVSDPGNDIVLRLSDIMTHISKPRFFTMVYPIRAL